MNLLAPSYLHLLWIIAIPVALWLFRRKAKRVNVSTLLFFRTLAREHNESAWLRTVKKWLSLLLTLLIIFLGVLALARPTKEAAGDTPGSVVCMIDCSASMAATDGTTSRLDEAKRLARNRVRGLPDSVVVSLIAFDDKPTVLLSRSRNRREFTRLLDGIQSTPIEDNAEAALAAAKRLAALEQPAQIWHLGDHPITSPGTDIYRFTSVALAQVTNVGISGFQIRPAPLTRDRFEGFVRISASAANAGSVQATLEARIAGRIAHLRELELKPGESLSMILPLEGVRGQSLELELKAPGDCLGWDNAIIAPLPKVKPLIVAWIAEKPDPFTELALGSLIEAGRIEMLRGDPKNWPLKDKPDVYVFENWVPDAWPEDRPVVALSPPKSSGPVRVQPLATQVPYDAVRSIAAEHPVLYRINPSRLSLTQVSVLDASTALETLWLGGTEAMLLAGEFNGQRVVVTAFSPSRSEQLALLPAYPLLLGNALYWCAENADAMSHLKPNRTGELLSATGTVQWQVWDGQNFTTASDAMQSSLIKLQRIGLWATDDERSGASVLASTQETDVKAQSSTAGVSSESSVAAGLSWPQLLLWCVLGLLLLESFLFHRQAVY